MQKTVNYYRVKNKKSLLACAVVMKEGNLLAASELYTPFEVEKALRKKLIDEAFILKHFDRIELSPFNLAINADGGRFMPSEREQKTKYKSRKKHETK